MNRLRAFFAYSTGALAATCGGAFLIRATLHSRHSPWAGGDSEAYIQMARWLVEGNSTFINPHPPLYSFFLVLFYIIPHDSASMAIWSQILISIGTMILVYYLSRRWNSAWTSYLAAGIVGLDPFQIYFSTVFLSETLFTFLLVAGFYTLFGLAETPRFGRAFFCGIVFSLGALCRTILSPFLPLVALSILVILRASLRRHISLIAAFVLGIALPMAVWSAYLHHRTGHWVLVSPQKGWNCYEGLNPHFERPDDVAQWQQHMTDDVAREGLKTSIDIDTYFWNKSIQLVKSQPGETLILMIRKFFKFWRFWPYSPYSLRERIISAIFMSFLIPFAVIGFFHSVDKPKIPMETIVLAIFMMIYAGANTITWTEIRYRVPLHPLLAIFAAIGLTRTISFIKEHLA